MIGSEAQSVAQSNRRWRQFSVRGLLLLTAVCALVFGVVTHKWRVDQRRRSIGEEFCRVGGYVNWEASPWWTSEVVAARFIPDDFYHAQRSWKGEGITDAVIMRLAPRLACVKYLALDGSEITDKSLAVVGKMRRLRCLGLTSTAVTDVGLQELGRLPRLEELHLRGAGISDRSLSWLARLLVRKDFKVPIVSRVTDEALIYLGRISTLKKLDLGMTEVTDLGLSRLVSLTQLEELGLAGTLISDKGLVHLEQLPRLRVLDLGGTGVTDDGVKRLQEALPKCKIVR